MNVRPRTMGIPSTSKYDPETALSVTRVLPAPVAVSAKATRNGASNCGLTAANAVIVASLVTAWIIAVRFSSLLMSINTVSAVLKPGSNGAEAIALRRKTAAQISSSADANTCTPTSALRARPGRASLTNSPFFFSSRRRHTRLQGDWSSDVCSSDLSGNVIFEADGASSAALERRIEAHLRQRLGFEVNTFVRNETEVRSIAEHEPFAEARSEERRVGKEGRSRWAPYH